MAGAGLEREVTAVLDEMNRRGGYSVALICTDDGLLIAASGDHVTSEELAGVTSLFDDIVVRSERDLGARHVDEVTVLDPGVGRLIVRRLPIGADRRFFMVVRAPVRASWRRLTSDACRDIASSLRELTMEAT
jgi:predicted regulator of Ras-like GTPase activity (Roadblock/LC7/MglB family)